MVYYFEVNEHVTLFGSSHRYWTVSDNLFWRSIRKVIERSDRVWVVDDGGKLQYIKNRCEAVDTSVVDEKEFAWIVLQARNIMR